MQVDPEALEMAARLARLEAWVRVVTVADHVELAAAAAVAAIMAAAAVEPMQIIVALMAAAAVAVRVLCLLAEFVLQE